MPRLPSDRIGWLRGSTIVALGNRILPPPLHSRAGPPSLELVASFLGGEAMRSVRFVCSSTILISVLALAQSGRAALGIQPNGLPVALELQLGAPHVQQGAPFAQRQRTGDGAGALGGRSRRRNAKRPAQTGPEQVLYAFLGGSDGGNPSSGLIFDASGNLYGTTKQGGGGTACGSNYAGCGTAFELSSNSNGGWTETILYSFQGSSDGALRSSGLIFDHAGNLYGTTAQGGTEGEELWGVAALVIIGVALLALAPAKPSGERISAAGA
jgi:hypothetical protein